ncbi:MAG: serine/threonine-protein kinase [Parachlamydiales bacterium]|nr:serine/threonine-protein kinase [Parachlamydiales bacterium]
MNPIPNLLSAKTIKPSQKDDELFLIAFNEFEHPKYHVRVQKSAPFFKFRYSELQVILDDKVTSLWISNADLIGKFMSLTFEVEKVISRFPRFMATLLKDSISRCTEEAISEESIYQTLVVANRHLYDEQMSCYKKREAVRTFLAGQGRSYLLFTRHQKKGDRIIGGGATKTGKLGINLQSGQFHALLVCRKAYLSHESEWNQVLNEVEILKELRGTPGVLQLYDSVATPEKIYMVTEFFNRGDLEKVFLSKTFLSLGDKLSIAFQITLGLWNMHVVSIVHRDLKPPNILLSITYRTIKAVIGDFGSACKTNHLAMAQTVTGSVAYMAPEKVKALGTDEWAATSTPEADVWALGLIFFSLFHEKMGTLMSFQIEDDLESAIKNLKNESIEKELDASGIHAPIASLLKMMLQIDPKERIPPKTIFKLLGSAQVELPPELGGLKD